MTFDMRLLANSLVNNKQWNLAPTDTFRMGIVAGYDPAFSFDDGATTFPAVSVQLAGDERMMHGFRFAEHYVPQLGDTVWVIISPDDHWVMGALATSADERSKRSPMTFLGSATGSGKVNPSVTTGFLPNRNYRVEGQVHFKTTGPTGFNQIGQILIKSTQPGTGTPLILETRDVTVGNEYYVTGSQFVSVTNPASWSNGAWNSAYPNSQYNWSLSVTPINLQTSYTQFSLNNSYAVGDYTVGPGGYLYQCVVPIQGSWNASATYQPGQYVVGSDNYVYFALVATNNQDPTAAPNHAWPPTSTTTWSQAALTWPTSGGQPAPSSFFFKTLSTTTPSITLNVISSIISVYDMGVAS